MSALAAAVPCAGGLPAGNAAMIAEMRVNRLEEDVLLFALRLDQATLSSTFPGFAARDGMLVPLGELCRLLDLAIQADPNRGRAEGFFIDEKHRFSLDVPAGTITIDGRSQTFDRSRVELHADDIYVDTRLIATWLPLDLQVTSRSATITVSPRVPLPLQERWQRERMVGRLRPAEGPRTFPRQGDPYRLLEIPMVDETLRFTAQNAPGTGQPFHAQSTTFATGDFLGLSSSLYAILDTHDGLSEFRMTMGRRDPHAGLLGPLKATEFAFGEVLDPGLNLLTLPMAGTGALLTNYPLQRENAFDRHSFQGDLPPGWQVEVYRNQALLGFQASRPDGRYEFLNVPLYYGWNDFRLVFYGPQGQRREEVARFDVSESQTPAGAFQYRVVGADPRQAGRRAQVEGRYGLSKQFTAGFSVSDLDLEGTRHTYTQASLQGFWKPLSATLTAVSDQLGGSIAELGIRSRAGSTSLTAKVAELQEGFVSEVFRPLYGPVRSRRTLETSTLLPSLARSLVTFDLGASQDQLVAGGSIDRIYNRISTSFHGYFLSNEITRTEGRSAAAPFPATTTGDLLASKFFRDVSLRGQANYQLNGPPRLNALSAFAETARFEPFNLRAGLTRSIVSGDTLVQLGAYKTQGAYALGLDFSYSTRSRLALDITLRVGLAREPRSGRIYAQAQGIASHGAVSARAFLDANGNGVKDPGEKPVQGVGFMANGASQPRTTDAQGVAFLSNLSGDLDANLSVSSSTLEDPLMRPGTPGVRITPRPGHVVLVDVPLVVFGEITGTAYLKRNGAAHELPGLLLELVTTQGKVVKTVRTAFDGFYTLSDLPPGTYLLRASVADLHRLGLAPLVPKAVTVTTEGTVVDGLDLICTPDLAIPATLREDVRKEERP
jgi:hypothetical protein